ncbi:PREDICTED: aldose 1-epimerase isoform X2 [Wasmannia auropunctata]|nr:PREDICTED: aldose 1-epimerase isoform X2 [Wasmannia auropunctata]XP_011686022.1 PREDICTED: aldose 1-epimerase isoform X2 [Wasmannia auropunctata]XP_011686023.1 PREDICTED: aldose 1-epimerase isoform X2 [Wasmannia auropunctata]XP_011686024.1 PREDICTED: aldose 1-epimerase isoform X2 [Wasmannia auropunctata]
MAARRSITTTTWGSVNGQEVKKFTLKNRASQEVDVITYGATLTAIRTPDKKGNVGDVLLGFDNIEGYLSSANPYFGATVGRVANRIGGATFVVDGQRYNVSKNLGQDSLHGGVRGWSFKVWDATIDGDRVVMTLISPDGDEGYPGTVTATVSFELKDDGGLCIEMKARSEKATPINLTNHAYFNLAGHATNAAELYKHVFVLNADRWTVTDSASIPTGEIRSVENSVMDLRCATRLGDVIDKVPGGGYDYNFCLPKPADQKIHLIARVSHPDSGRLLTVYSNQPGVQFYTANSMGGETGIAGKNGARYSRHAAFCLETQNYPDAVNHKNFPNSVLRPGDVYNHFVMYKFGVEPN